MRSFALKAAGLLQRFRKDEDGAMTVEWVAIAAAVVVGAVAITWQVMANLDPVSGQIGGQIDNAIGTVPTPPAITAPTFDGK